jgi:hypothetical protein
MRASSSACRFAISWVSISRDFSISAASIALFLAISASRSSRSFASRCLAISAFCS